jgi:hypothetical protein
MAQQVHLSFSKRDGNSPDDVLRRRMDNLMKLVAMALERFFSKSARGM